MQIYMSFDVSLLRFDVSYSTMHKNFNAFCIPPPNQKNHDSK